MTKSRERSFISLLNFCERVWPIASIRAHASAAYRNEGESDSELTEATKTEKNISESESSDSHDYHMVSSL